MISPHLHTVESRLSNINGPSERWIKCTFQYQSSLPSLPVPALDESLQKYLDSVRPFLKEEEFQQTQDIVERFENGIGKELHQKLFERAFAKHHKRMKEYEIGKGFGCHLLGLRFLSKEHSHPMPEIFLNTAFSRSGGGENFVLSTSLVGYTRVGGAVVSFLSARDTCSVVDNSPGNRIGVCFHCSIINSQCVETPYWSDLRMRKAKASINTFSLKL
uniref:Choline/carnitine acyltransferase domain-containing protein n=1 Tax=Anolis carolinensis TaxID=28377 RepID=A0A803TLD9_ANOCA